MNIFVAKLDYDTTSEDLRHAFEIFGEVSSSKVIFDRDTGRSKGFGFVEMPDKGEALNAIEYLNNSQLDGRTIVVKEANPPKKNNNNMSPYNRTNRYGNSGQNRYGGGYRNRY